MLKLVPALLGPELLMYLRAMGHGDEIAIVDGNYPALEHAKRLVRADGHGLQPVLDAVLRLLPGADAPSVLALDGNRDAVALQAVCQGTITWQHLEDMKRAGARSMLVLPVEQMLA